MESTIQQVNSMGSILFHTTNWDTVPVTQHQGESGTAYWQTLQFEGLRVRLVEYSKDYKAGHIVYCIEGEMISELADGRTFALSAGMTYQVSDNVSEHRSHSKEGVKLLIIDGNFLSHKKDNVLNPWKM